MDGLLPFVCNFWRAAFPEEPWKVWLTLTVSAVLPSFLFSRTLGDFFLTLSALLSLFFIWKKNPFTKTPLWVWGFMAFWMSVLVSSFYGPAASFWNTLRAFAFLRFGVFLLAFYLLKQDEKGQYFLFVSLLLTVAFVTFDTLLQWKTGSSLAGNAKFSGRLTSFFRRPMVGFFLSTLLFPLLSWFWQHFSKDRRPWLIISAGTVLIAVLLTGDRSLSLLLTAAFGFWILYSLSTHPAHRLKLGVLSLAFLVFLAGILFYDPFLYQRLIQLYRDLSHFSASSYGPLFKTAWLMGESAPLLGAGYKSFPIVNATLFEAHTVTYKGLHAHNYYLQTFAESGLLGLLSFIGFLATLVITIHQSTPKTKQFFCYLGLFMIFWPITASLCFLSNATAIVIFSSLGLIILQTTSKKAKVTE